MLSIDFYACFRCTSAAHISCGRSGIHHLVKWYSRLLMMMNIFYLHQSDIRKSIQSWFFHSRTNRTFSHHQLKAIGTGTIEPSEATHYCLRYCFRQIKFLQSKLDWILIHKVFARTPFISPTWFAILTLNLDWLRANVECRRQNGSVMIKCSDFSIFRPA